MVMSVLADAFVKAYSPWLFAQLRQGRAQDRLVAVGAVYVAAPVFFALAAFVGLILQAASVWLLGQKYQAASAVLPWFMAGGAASGVYMCTSGLFFFEARTALLASVTMSSAIGGAVLTGWLVSTYGLQGAAAGFACTQFLLALLTTSVAMRTFDLPWRDRVASFVAWWQACFGSDPAVATAPLDAGKTSP